MRGRSVADFDSAPLTSFSLTSWSCTLGMRVSEGGCACVFRKTDTRTHLPTCVAYYTCMRDANTVCMFDCLDIR